VPWLLHPAACSLVTTTETLGACDFATRLRSETDTLYKPSESLACCSVTTQHHTCSCSEGCSTLASALHLYLDINVKNWRSVTKITINVTSCYMKFCASLLYWDPSCHIGMSPLSSILVVDSCTTSSTIYNYNLHKNSYFEDMHTITKSQASKHKKKTKFLHAQSLVTQLQWLHGVIKGDVGSLGNYNTCRLHCFLKHSVNVSVTSRWYIV